MTKSKQKKDVTKDNKNNNGLPTYVFIDTNIFLDCYRKPDSFESIITKLSNPLIKNKIISTYHVEMEYLKKRQKVIALEANSVCNWKFVGQIRSWIHDRECNKLKKEIEKNLKTIQDNTANSIRSLISEPHRDQVFKTVKTIFESDAQHVLKRNMTIRDSIKEKARKRSSLGYPPRKEGDTTYGDAINWEWIVHCGIELEGNIIIVTRDEDYGVKFEGQLFLNDQLKKEFLERTKNDRISITNRLSEALEELDVDVSQEEKQAETDAILTPSGMSFSAFSQAALQYNEAMGSACNIAGILKNINFGNSMLSSLLQYTPIDWGNILRVNPQYDDYLSSSESLESEDKETQ